MAQSAVSVALHITENQEQYKHQRVLMTLQVPQRGGGVDWQQCYAIHMEMQSPVPVEEQSHARKLHAWKSNSQKAALQKRTWSSNKLSASQEGGLAKATSNWTAPEQHCQHFGGGDTSSHASFSKCLDFCCFAEEFWNYFLEERFVPTLVLLKRY